MKKLIAVIVVGCVVFAVGVWASGENAESADRTQRIEQEKLLQEATAQTGMPAIVNFRERKLAKQILEMRDQEGLLTYTYAFNEFAGKYVFLGRSIGFPLPYSAQYTNPEKIAGSYSQGGFAILPQADPNALFSPASAEGTWVLLVDETTGKPSPAYFEQRITCLTFKLPARLVQQ